MAKGSRASHWNGRTVDVTRNETLGRRHSDWSRERQDESSIREELVLKGRGV